MPFDLHPCIELRALYNQRWWQGQHPEQADIIFLSTDANWHREIEFHNVFPSVKEYLQDGVAYWRNRGFHHPLLLPCYKGDGKIYHRNFTKLGLTQEHAARVSFVELLQKPTYGYRKDDLALYKELVKSDENRNHIIRLYELLTNIQDKLIFITSGAYNHIVGQKLMPNDSFINVVDPAPFFKLSDSSQGKSTVLLTYSFSNRYWRRIGKEDFFIQYKRIVHDYLSNH